MFEFWKLVTRESSSYQEEALTRISNNSDAFEVFINLLTN